MRSLFLVLLLANLLFFAARFDVVRGLLPGSSGAAVPRPPQLNAERMRIIRDTSLRPTSPTPAAG